MYKFTGSIEKNPYVGSNQTIHIAAILSESQWKDIEISAETTRQDIKELITEQKYYCHDTENTTYRNLEHELEKLIDELAFYEALIYTNLNRRIVYGNLW